MQVKVIMPNPSIRATPESKYEQTTGDYVLKAAAEVSTRFAADFARSF